MGLHTRMGMLPRPLMVMATPPTKWALLFEVAELRDQAERLPVETYLIRERRLLLAASEVAANLSSAEIAPSLDYVRHLVVDSKEDAAA